MSQNDPSGIPEFLIHVLDMTLQAADDYPWTAFVIWLIVAGLGLWAVAIIHAS